MHNKNCTAKTRLHISREVHLKLVRTSAVEFEAHQPYTAEGGMWKISFMAQTGFEIRYAYFPTLLRYRFDRKQNLCKFKSLPFIIFS